MGLVKEERENEGGNSSEMSQNRPKNPLKNPTISPKYLQSPQISPKYTQNIPLIPLGEPQRNPKILPKKITNISKITLRSLENPQELPPKMPPNPQKTPSKPFRAPPKHHQTGEGLPKPQIPPKKPQTPPNPPCLREIFQAGPSSARSTSIWLSLVALPSVIWGFSGGFGGF